MIVRDPPDATVPNEQGNAVVQDPEFETKTRPDGVGSATIMFAAASIQGGRTATVLAVPEAAVTLIQGLPTVFVEEAAGFEARSVELGERSGGNIVIKAGLKAGELVVVEGVYALKARKLKSQIGEGHAH